MPDGCRIFFSLTRASPNPLQVFSKRNLKKVRNSVCGSGEITGMMTWMCRLLQDMYYEPLDYWARARTSNINEELGQVRANLCLTITVSVSDNHRIYALHCWSWHVLRVRSWINLCHIITWKSLSRWPSLCNIQKLLEYGDSGNSVKLRSTN